LPRRFGRPHRKSAPNEPHARRNRGASGVARAPAGLPGWPVGSFLKRSVLPNILVYVDFRGGRPTTPALFAISEARRVSRMAGASLYAVALTSPLSAEELEALARPIGEAGADKLLLCEANDFAGPPLDFTHGRGLDAAAARVPPMMVLFPAGGAGDTLGPSLAARLGGPFAPWCDFLTTDAETTGPEGSGRVQLIHCRQDGRSRRRLDPLEIERPIVATLFAGRRSAPVGSARDLETEVLSSIAPIRPLTSVQLQTDRQTWDRREILSLASVLVLIGNGDDGLPLIPPEILRAGAPPGVAVECAADVPAAVLGGCCPEIVLKIGRSPARTARAPRTRVVLAAVAPTPADDLATEEVDVLWPFRSREDLTATAVATLLAQIGEVS